MLGERAVYVLIRFYGLGRGISLGFLSDVACLLAVGDFGVHFISHGSRWFMGGHLGEHDGLDFLISYDWDDLAFTLYAVSGSRAFFFFGYGPRLENRNKTMLERVCHVR